MTWELPRGEALGNCRDSVRLVVRVNQPRVIAVLYCSLLQGDSHQDLQQYLLPAKALQPVEEPTELGLVPGSYLLAA